MASEQGKGLRARLPFIAVLVVIAVALVFAAPLGQ